MTSIVEASAMQRSRVSVLSFITAIENLPSLVEHGILSHNDARDIEHESIADEAVQVIRAAKVVNGRHLHDYANVYLWARNGMMSARRDADICVLTVNCAVLDLPDVFYSDRNAARRDAVFARCGGDFEHIDEHLLRSSWFGDREQMGYTQAEVLVPDTIHPRYFAGVIVDTEEKAGRVRAMRTGLGVFVRPDWFFAE